MPKYASEVLFLDVNNTLKTCEAGAFHTSEGHRQMFKFDCESSSLVSDLRSASSHVQTTTRIIEFGASADSWSFGSGGDGGLIGRDTFFAFRLRFECVSDAFRTDLSLAKLRTSGHSGRVHTSLVDKSFPPFPLRSVMFGTIRMFSVIISLCFESQQVT